MSKSVSAFLLACIISFFTRLIFLFPYLRSDFVVLDDAIVLPVFLLGETMSITGAQIMYLLFDAISWLGSVTTYRIFFLLVTSCNSGIISAFLTRYVSKVTAILISLAITTVPISVDQVVFVTGSHPSLALLFILSFLLLFDRIVNKDINTSELVQFSLVSALFLFAAAFSSPTALIVIIALPIAFTIVTWLKRGQVTNPFRLWVLLLIVTTTSIIAYIAAGQTSYHYEGKAGYTDYTITHIINNLITSTKALYNSYNNVYIKWAIFGGLAIIASVALHHWLTRRRHRASSDGDSSSRNLVLVAFIALILSALSFGPASITVNLLNRYLVMPATLGLLAVVAIGVSFLGIGTR